MRRNVPPPLRTPRVLIVRDHWCAKREVPDSCAERRLQRRGPRLRLGLTMGVPKVCALAPTPPMHRPAAAEYYLPPPPTPPGANTNGGGGGGVSTTAAKLHHRPAQLLQSMTRAGPGRFRNVGHGRGRTEPHAATAGRTARAARPSCPFPTASRPPSVHPPTVNDVPCKTRLGANLTEPNGGVWRVQQEQLDGPATAVRGEADGGWSDGGFRGR